MIVSASYKTDIPAFYGRWFLNRLRAGYCRMVNPYSGKALTVELSRSAVDGFVFWTKNLGPFLAALEEVRERGYPFVVQYAINRYPRALEAAVVDVGSAVEHMRRLRREFGPRAAVWRYDPVVATSVTDFDHHRRAFAELAAQIEGTTDEVVISFAQIYRKTRTNLEAAAVREGFTWDDPADAEKAKLARDLAAIARRHGMGLTVCSQRRFTGEGSEEARCIDAVRLSDVAGRPISAPVKGNREECACHQSRDIGEYDTCPHGCVYCYAVRSRTLAKRRFLEHDPEGEFLFRQPRQPVKPPSAAAG